MQLDASTVTLHGTRKLKEAHGSHVILNVRHKVGWEYGTTATLPNIARWP